MNRSKKQESHAAAPLQEHTCRAKGPNGDGRVEFYSNGKVRADPDCWRCVDEAMQRALVRGSALFELVNGLILADDYGEKRPGEATLVEALEGAPARPYEEGDGFAWSTVHARAARAKPRRYTWRRKLGRKVSSSGAWRRFKR